MKCIHHFAKKLIFSLVSEWNAARPSRIMEHPMRSAQKGFTYEITSQLTIASSLKFQLSLCTGCAMFFHLWSLFLACASADSHINRVFRIYTTHKPRSSEVCSAYAPSRSLQHICPSHSALGICAANFRWPWFSGRSYIRGIHRVTMIYILNIVWSFEIL